MDKRDAPGNGYNVNQAQYAAAAAAQQAKNTYAAQTAQAAHQAQAVVAAHQAQAAQITQAAYAAQAQAHAASQYGGYEAQNAYQNAQQWSNMAQASLINLHAAQQAANKATDIAGAAQASAEGHLGQYGGFVGHGYGSK